MSNGYKKPLFEQRDFSNTDQNNNTGEQEIQQHTQHKPCPACGGHAAPRYGMNCQGSKWMGKNGNAFTCTRVESVYKSKYYGWTHYFADRDCVCGFNHQADFNNEEDGLIDLATGKPWRQA